MMLRYSIVLLVISYLAGSISGHDDNGGLDQVPHTSQMLSQTSRADSCELTTSDTEGPYYKPDAPLQPLYLSAPPAICPHTVADDRLFINGTVRIQGSGNTCGTPTKALIDVWQSNEAGIYSPHDITKPDYTCRIRFYTNNNGQYALASLFPGRYLNDYPNGVITGYRPAHIHFKVTPVNDKNEPLGPTFTTQLYFAKDKFLSPNDGCPATVCGSGSPPQIVDVRHYSDVKTYEGTWNINLNALPSPSSTTRKPNSSANSCYVHSTAFLFAVVLSFWLAISTNF